MGILNVTPDSFSDGGQYLNPDAAIEHGLQMEKDGAHILDIGGESTRPGAMPVAVEAEIQRVIPVIKGLREKSSIPISVDTYKSEVAQAALEAGASMINDISGLNFDPRIVDIAAQFDCPVVVMHIAGTPQTMQNNPVYTDVVTDIVAFFEIQVERLIRKGLKDENIIVDPGIGFGKRVEDNFVLLNRLSEFQELGFPVLVGPSRKSFIGVTLDLPVDQRLEGTLAAVSVAIIKGARVVRVHDVRETVRTVKIVDQIRRAPD
ncbi:MAG: dihydropteroate synthase [FCB group bacterium]|nr:dihydropteroate synthase [FCB group bacterium]